MHRGSWVLIAGSLLVGTACAHGRAAVSDAGIPPNADSVTVVVANHFAAPMDVFARTSGQDYRMGTVEPGATNQFVLRFGWLWGRSVEFVAEGRFQSGQRARSGHLNLRPGDVVDFVMTTGSSRATLRP